MLNFWCRHNFSDPLEREPSPLHAYNCKGWLFGSLYLYIDTPSYKNNWWTMKRRISVNMVAIITTGKNRLLESDIDIGLNII